MMGHYLSEMPEDYQRFIREGARHKQTASYFRGRRKDTRRGEDRRKHEREEAAEARWDWDENDMGREGERRRADRRHQRTKEEV